MVKKYLHKRFQCWFLAIAEIPPEPPPPHSRVVTGMCMREIVYSIREKDQPPHPRPPCFSTCSLFVSHGARAAVADAAAAAVTGASRRHSGGRCPVLLLRLLLHLSGGLSWSSFARHSTCLTGLPIFPFCHHIFSSFYVYSPSNLVLLILL